MRSNFISFTQPSLKSIPTRRKSHSKIPNNLVRKKKHSERVVIWHLLAVECLQRRVPHPGRISRTWSVTQCIMNARVAPSSAPAPAPGAFSTLGSSAVYLTDPRPLRFRPPRSDKSLPTPGPTQPGYGLWAARLPPAHARWHFLMHRTRNGANFSLVVVRCNFVFLLCPTEPRGITAWIFYEMAISSQIRCGDSAKVFFRSDESLRSFVCCGRIWKFHRRE